VKRLKLPLIGLQWSPGFSTVQADGVHKNGWEIKAWFVCGWPVKLCDPIVTHGPYPNALEIKGL